MNDPLVEAISAGMSALDMVPDVGYERRDMVGSYAAGIAAACMAGFGVAFLPFKLWDVVAVLIVTVPVVGWSVFWLAGRGASARTRWIWWTMLYKAWLSLHFAVIMAIFFTAVPIIPFLAAVGLYELTGSYLMAGLIPSVLCAGASRCIASANSSNRDPLARMFERTEDRIDARRRAAKTAIG